MNPNTDTANCGGCGQACPLGFACVAGGCRPLEGTDAGPCNPPSLQCGPNCSDIRNDNLNCGRCGNPCAADRVCVTGMCLPFCAAGESRCAGGCINVQADRNNCGACGNVCGAGLNCFAGQCVVSACLGNPQWMPVSCTTRDWVWSMDRARAMTLAAANTARVLATGCNHGGPQPALGQGLCSLDGTGYVSTRTFVMAGCDRSWAHLPVGAAFNCGGHDGDTYRLLALGANDCYAY